MGRGLWEPPTGASGTQTRKWSAFWTQDLKDLGILPSGTREGVCWGDVFECFSVHTDLFLAPREAGCAKWVGSAREGQEVSLSAGNNTSFLLQMLALTLMPGERSHLAL